MVTKYNTGDEVLIPAKVRSAAERNGQIIYYVDTDNIWDGISEENIILNENSKKILSCRPLLRLYLNGGDKSKALFVA